VNVSPAALAWEAATGFVAEAAQEADSGRGHGGSAQLHKPSGLEGSDWPTVISEVGKGVAFMLRCFRLARDQWNESGNYGESRTTD